MTDNNTPLRPIRIEEDLWAEFGRLAGPRNRSQMIRDFVRWYVRERGAQLPARPESAGIERSERNPELTQTLMRARNNLAHSSPGGMAVSSDEAEGLLPKELQILLLVADGLSDAEIATALKVAPKTAKTYIRKVAAKIRAAGQAKIYIPQGQLKNWPTDTQTPADPAGD